MDVLWTMFKILYAQQRIGSVRGKSLEEFVRNILFFIESTRKIKYNEK